MRELARADGWLYFRRTFLYALLLCAPRTILYTELSAATGYKSTTRELRAEHTTFCVVFLVYNTKQQQRAVKQTTEQWTAMDIGLTFIANVPKRRI